MLLGIEIGGTKLQIGVGAGDGSAVGRPRCADVEPAAGAVGILSRIEAEAATLLCERFPSGGSASASVGRSIRRRDGLFAVIKSKAGTIFRSPNGASGRSRSPAVVGNDCDVAGLAEAQIRSGARTARRLLCHGRQRRSAAG